ncbi:MAG: cobalamin biosynthesis protein CobD [Firmicutes bacterium]|nr:cobalamin biosynthesis protein CobD [Bacillota bacterium]
MNFFKFNAIAMLAGFVLDLLIGDPEGWPHPVIWIGKYISLADRKIRDRAAGDSAKLRRGSVWMTVSTVFIAMAATAAVMRLAMFGGNVVLLIVMSILSWTCLSAKCLAKEANGVAKALKRSLEDGRKQVGRIVGRDTAALSEEDIVAATVETVAENTTDGIVSPLIYLLIGGPVLAIGFKAASTLDSMEGYLDEKYRDIGWCGAKLDDVLNFIPARICGLLMCLSAGLLKGLDGKNALRIMKRDHANHLSPNCAWSESAAAGALHVQLGGSHEYFGKIIEKPSIGDDDRPLKRGDILLTNRLMYGTSIITVMLLFALGMLV